MSRRAFERWDWACYVAAGRLTTAQRAVLVVVARHAGESSAGARISQATIAEATDLVDRSVRRALDRLEAMGLIAGESRPGKTTVWALNLDWTPDTSVRPPRTLTPGVQCADPGRTPDVPRTPVSYEGEGEGKKPLSLPTEARDERASEIEFDARNLVSIRRVAA
jgi:hypothetical protein